MSVKKEISRVVKTQMVKEVLYDEFGFQYDAVDVEEKVGIVYYNDGSEEECEICECGGFIHCGNGYVGEGFECCDSCDYVWSGEVTESMIV